MSSTPASPTTDAPIQSVPSAPQPSGLGGWLILVGINLIWGPIGILSMFSELSITFKPENWQLLTSPDSPYFHPWIGPTIISETIINVVMLLFYFALIALFFMRSVWFPKLFIGLLWFNALFLTIDMIVVSQVPLLAANAEAAVMGVLKGFLIATIWTTYLKVSVRVRNTFVAQPSA